MREPMTGSASITVEALPVVVYGMVTDVTRMGELSPECTGGEWLDGATHPVPGARFRGTNRRGKGIWSTTCEVLTAEPGEELTFVTGSRAKPATTWRYRFEADPDGGTIVTESFEVHRYGTAQRLTNRFLLGIPDRRADMVSSVEQTLQRLKAAVDPGRGAPAR